jgi:S-(hydroxymethyl)glutathione dehydrogenase/alcohol dehydrogenase
MRIKMAQGTQKIQAAICREFGKPLSVETVGLAPPGPDDILVRVEACAICHSDISFIDGEWGGTLPSIWGHEAAGTIESVGSNVRHLQSGDRVVVTLVRSCGDCHYCEREAPVACESDFALDQLSPLTDDEGQVLGHGLRTGAFAEKVVVHASQVVPIPADLPADAASLLACGVLTGWGAVTQTAKMAPGASALVIGLGGVGLNTLQAIQHVGGAPAMVIDPSDAKRSTAMEFGATAASDIDPAAADAMVQRETSGRGAEYVFVTAGAPGAFQQGLSLLASTGTLVIVGMPANGVEASISPGNIAAAGQKILGSKMGSTVISRDVPALVAAYQEGRLKLDELVSGKYPLAEINAAIEDVKSGNAIRNVIIFEPAATGTNPHGGIDR